MSIHPISNPGPAESLSFCNFLENFLQKVHSIALSCLEQFASWFYAKLYQPCLEGCQFLSTQIISPTTYFADGAPLYDRTTNQIAGITQMQIFFPGQESLSMEFITLNGKKVFLHHSEPHVHLQFGRQFRTSYVSVENFPGSPNFVRIIEREAGSQNPKIWNVDLNKVFIKNTMGGQLVLAQEEVYLSEDQISALEPSDNLYQTS
ncbi:MAG: hypothetical protein Tsb0015_00850 [Simkaniaceae bacterium]